MSSLIVEVCRVESIEKHPDPTVTKLRVLKIKGWQVVTASADVEEGSKVVYVPPDVVLTEEVAAKWGVLPYLKPLPKNQFGERPAGGRVGVARLKGVHSFGFVAPCDDPNWEVGTNVAEYYKITKWEPPVECLDGDAEREASAFHKYTDIENIRNFPDALVPGEMVVVTEKIHGKNSRAGLCRAADEAGNMTFTWMAGSHGVQRKEFTKDGKRSEFWEVLTPNVKALLEEVSAGENNVVIFGEIYGSGVQDMVYGFANGKRGYRAFDLAVNGRYLDYNAKAALFEKHGVESVPVLYIGGYNSQIVQELTTGPTTVL
jgi:RNA ligase (TIGR02306 family)